MAYALAERVTLPRPIDSVIFDVDGVLWDTTGSYDSAIFQTIDLLVRNAGREDLVGSVTFSDLRAMRLAGGLNSDWDLTYVVLTSLLAGWYDLKAVAGWTGGRGREWAEEQRGPVAELEFRILQRWFDHVYWGSDRIDVAVDSPPVVNEYLPGTWHAEKPFVTSEILTSLQNIGIDSMGIATGRPLVELQTVLDHGPLLDFIDIECMCHADILKKPDPSVVAWCVDRMRRATDQRESVATVLYAGDTRDDLDLVLNYRQWEAREKVESLWIGAVSVVPEAEFSMFLDAGAVACIDHVRELPAVVQEFNARTGLTHE